MRAKPKPKPKAKTIDEYLATLSDDKRAALERLREIIRAEAPEAEECISYQLPAFRLDGKPLVAFGATANHCAFDRSGRAPMACRHDGEVIKELRGEIEAVVPAYGVHLNAKSAEELFLPQGGKGGL